jgi:Malectin domain
VFEQLRAGKIVFKLKLVILAKLLIATAVSAYEVISAINCGGGYLYDTDGHLYSEDTNFTGAAAPGVPSHWNNGTMLMDGVPELNRPLYLYFRYSTRPLSYLLPVTGDGSYALILKLSDTDNQREGYHVFNVTIDAQPVLNKVDIFKLNGKRVYDEVIRFQICDGYLVLPSLDPVFVGNDTLNLGFHPVALVATIDAILLLKGNPGETITLSSSPKKVSPLTFDYELCEPPTTVHPSTTNSTTPSPTTSTTTRPVNPNIWQKLLTSIVSIQNSNNTFINVVNNFWREEQRSSK